jgi:hypothetical protein
MENLPARKSLLDAYRAPGFQARSRVEAHEREAPAFTIALERRQREARAARINERHLRRRSAI